MKTLQCMLAAALMGGLFNAVNAADPAAKPSTAATPAAPPPVTGPASPTNPHAASVPPADAVGAPSRLPPGYGPDGKKKPAAPFKMVDLNNAGKADLMTLPSVGSAEADKIIANRPYISKVDLVTKAGLPEGVYLAVRHKTIVNDMKKPAAKKPAPKSSEAK